MKFFFDSCVSPKYAAILKFLGVDVTHLHDHYPADSKDTVWIPEVATKGWVAVSWDSMIKKKPMLAEILERSGLHIYFLPSKIQDKKLFEQASWLLKVWQSIEHNAERRREDDPLVWIVTENGKVLSWEENKKVRKEKHRKRKK